MFGVVVFSGPPLFLLPELLPPPQPAVRENTSMVAIIRKNVYFFIAIITPYLKLFVITAKLMPANQNCLDGSIIKLFSDIKII
jgi:hypothetical protein